MRALFASLAIVMALLTKSCSQPEGTTVDNAESEGRPGNVTRSSPVDLASTVPGLPGERRSVETLAAPSLEFTGPVHESPGIVDNREAQVAFDLLKMEDGTAKSLALTELFRRWAEDDLDAAMGFFPYVVKDMENKRAYLRGVAPELLEHDPERLLDIIEEHWWQGHWDAYVQVMTKVTDSNLDLAVDFYTNTNEGKQTPHLAEKIARNLMDDRSFEEAEAFAMSIERPDSRGRAMQGIFLRWAKQDPDAAVTYLNQISDSAIRDYAIRGMVQQTADWSPEESLVWTMTMQVGEVRTNAVRLLARRWHSGANHEFFEKMMVHPLLTDGERDAIRQSTVE